MLSNKNKILRTIISLCLLTCILVTSFSEVPAKAATTTKTKYSGNYVSAYKVLDLVNAERRKVGAPALTMDQELLDAAMLRAHEIKQSFSHTRPNGADCFSAAPGRMYGENIAYGYSSPEAVMNGWMNSDGHRKNILNSSYRSIGIGCYEYNGTLYWVQCFGFATAVKPQNIGTWEKTNNKWRLLLTNGTYVKDWEKVDGSWYFFDANGYMKTGWIKSNGYWYYLKSDGTMKKGWQKSDGDWYYLSADGTMTKGWKKIDGHWYYFNAYGIMKTGWIKNDGNWYYLYSDGTLAMNTTIDGNRVGANGAWIK